MLKDTLAYEKRRSKGPGVREYMETLVQRNLG
jgi:hypothetical protein